MKPIVQSACAFALLAAAGPALATGAEGVFVKPDQVTVQASALGRVLADAHGDSLYTFDADAQRPGESTCVAACAAAWPPLAAAPDVKPVGDWSTIKRADGTLQWTYLSKPVYTFQIDRKAGDVAGDGAQRVWHVVRYVPPEPPLVRPAVVTLKLIGEDYVLADHRGMTLYQAGKDAGQAASCETACLRTWHPLEAAALAHDVGGWVVVTRDDGTRQWAYKSRPLYLYDGDGKPGAADGDGADGGWQVARP
jgi:predicted lipoprotein with Yx(FWY)xxD motif